MTRGTAGSALRVMYRHEDAGFKQTPNDSADKPFGGDATLDRWEGNNHIMRVMQPGTRAAADVLKQYFEGAWSVSGTLTNAWWLKEALHDSASTVSNDPDGDGTDEYYSHSFDGEDPSSMRIYTYDSGNDVERSLIGCVVGQLKIDSQVEGPAKFTLSGAYATEATTESPESPRAQPDLDYDVLEFKEATVERPDGTELSLVQSASFQLQNNTELVRELGSDEAVDYIPHQRVVSIDYGDIVHNYDNVARMYGSSTASSPKSDMSNRQDIVLRFYNGKTDAARNVVELTARTALPDSYGESGGGDPKANLEGSLSEVAADVTATIENKEPTPL